MAQQGRARGTISDRNMHALHQKLNLFENLVSQLAQVEAEIRETIDKMQADHRTEVHRLNTEIIRLRQKAGDLEADNETLNKAVWADESHGSVVATANPLVTKLSAEDPLPRSKTAPRSTLRNLKLRNQKSSTKRSTTAFVPPPPVEPPPPEVKNSNKLGTPRNRHSRTRSAPPKDVDLSTLSEEQPTQSPLPMRDKATSVGYAEMNRSRAVGRASRGSAEKIDLLNGVPSSPPGAGVAVLKEAENEDESPIHKDKKERQSKKKKRLSPDAKLPANELTEREFYKKYWIEAGKIGEGAFARVRRITRKDDKKVFALKMIKKRGKSKADIIALQKEIYVLQQCDHRNIVKLMDWCDTKKRIYMVVEFCDGGDVFERVIQLKKFSEADAAHVIRQVASGLAHLHERGFIHRDLKPDNLMYLTKAQDSEIKVIDFGLAGDATEKPCTTPCGTAHYAAPEVLSSTPYNVEADMWSLGVILYTLLCGFPPFFDANNNLKNLYHLIKKAKYAFPSPFWDEISDGAKDLVKKCLVKEPKERITAPQVLSHPWVAGKQSSNVGFSARYMTQMEHWQSTRHQTERQLGDGEDKEPNEPLNLYAQNWEKN